MRGPTAGLECLRPRTGVGYANGRIVGSPQARSSRGPAIRAGVGVDLGQATDATTPDGRLIVEYRNGR
jgi:hypothetical protein